MKDKKDYQDHELDCLVHDIRRVELAKKDKPELYSKALAKLKGEAKAIMSIDDLKERAKELDEGDDYEPKLDK